MVDPPVRAVWEVLEQVDRYPTWWPWLRRFDGTTLATGECWRCEVSSPLPWTLELVVELGRVEPGRVEATVSGDAVGTARVVLTAEGGRTAIAFDATLRAARGLPRLAHRGLPGLSRWAHDRVVDTALEQFCERALPPGGGGPRSSG